MVKSILIVLFSKTKPWLLKEICGIIAEFVVSPPHHEDQIAIAKALAAIKKKEQKKKKRNQDDEEWDE